MPHRRRSHRRWRGRHPALRWGLQRVAERTRGATDRFEMPHSHFWCDTLDDVRLAGTRLGVSSDTAVVVVHGFMGYRQKPKWRVLSQGLAQHFTVLTFDLRGHGQSGGACTGGEHETLDVHAVVQYARDHGFERVVTVGGSLGGIAVVREGALYDDVDGVVAISTPARWNAYENKAVRRATWLFTSRAGRALARRVMGTRIHLDWGNPEAPVDLVGKIAPTPLLLVHGANDHFFPAEAARELLEAAGEPKDLWLLDGFGHAEDGFTEEFAAALAARIHQLLTPTPSL